MAWKTAAALAAAGATALGAGLAIAQGPDKGPDKPRGYLGEAAAPDTLRILPPAPQPGSIRYEADRDAYRDTRPLQGKPRWAMASDDIDQDAFLAHAACAVGVELTPANAPRTLAILKRAGPDIGRATGRPKDHYKRQRPYQIDPGPTCQEQSEGLGRSPDYPSGHTTYGWTYGLILAELAPDRATPILVRARAFGESRVVCGVHNASAVEAGRTNASILVAALHGSPQFRRDMDGARKEVAAARARGPAPDPAACAAQAELEAPTPY
jgi:acid phosphatase (class A)